MVVTEDTGDGRSLMEKHTWLFGIVAAPYLLMASVFILATLVACSAALLRAVSSRVAPHRIVRGFVDAFSSPNTLKENCRRSAELLFLSETATVIPKSMAKQHIPNDCR
jgi:hypothetical protein